MRVPSLYEKYYIRRIFSFDRAKKDLNISSHNLKLMIYNLKKRGYIGSIKKGLYYIIPFENIDREYTVNRFLIGANLLSNYSLSFHTALEIHGISYSNFNMVYISTNNYRESFEFQGNIYKPVISNTTIGVEEKDIDGIPIRVTNIERTIIDCLNKIEYVGGLEEFLKSVSILVNIDQEKLLGYLLEFNKKILFAKCGWLLSMLEKYGHFEFQIKDKIKKMTGDRTYDLIKFDKDEKIYVDNYWNLRIPMRLNELIRNV